MQSLVTMTDVQKQNPLLVVLKHYVRHFGKNVDPTDFAIGLPVSHQDLTVDMVPRAFARLGLTAYIVDDVEITQDILPVCALMNNGHYAIIHSKNDETYQIERPGFYEGIRKFPIKEMNDKLANKIIIAGHAFEAIEEKHIPQKEKGHWFWSHFKNQRVLIRDIILGTLTANILAVAISLFTLQVYDRVIPNQSVPTLWVLVCGVVIAILLEAMLRVARATLIDISGREIEIKISTMLFQRFMGMRLSKRPQGPGSLLYSMREFGSVREFFTTSSISSAADIPFVIIFVGLIYTIAGNIAYIIVAAMVLIIVPSLFARSRMEALSEEMLGGHSSANKVLIQSAYGLDTIKSLRAESYFQGQWEEILELTSEKTTQQRLLAAKLTFWAQGVQQTAYISAIVAGVYMVFLGELTVGAIIAISILTSRTLSPVTSLSNVLARWQQVRSSLDGLDMIADSEQEKPPGKHFVTADSLEGDFALSDIIYQYHEEAPNALEISALTLKAGQNIGLLGTNGSGKSTLLKLLSGLYDANHGQITIDALSMSQVSPEDLRRHIGYLTQETKLFTGTLRQNLELAVGPCDDSRLFEALQFSGLAGHVKAHPLGLDMPISDGETGVSVGQKQSIGLARLYLQDPSIVLLDEPTASFDQMLERQIVNNLKAWLVGKTCVLSTHRPAALELLDEIVVLQHGKVYLQGPAKDVIAKLSAPKPSVEKIENAKILRSA